MPSNSWKRLSNLSISLCEISVLWVSEQLEGLQLLRFEQVESVCVTLTGTSMERRTSGTEDGRLRHSQAARVCLRTEYAENPYKCKTHHLPELPDLQSCNVVQILH